MARHLEVRSDAVEPSDSGRDDGGRVRKRNGAAQRRYAPRRYAPLCQSLRPAVARTSGIITATKSQMTSMGILADSPSSSASR